MLSWFYFALISSFLAGLGNFVFALSSKEKVSVRKLIFYYSISGIIGYLFFGLFLHVPFTKPFSLVVIGGIIGVFVYVTIGSKIEALKSISSNLYFQASKIVSTILILLGGILIFHDSFSNLQKIGILTAVAVPLLLLTKKERSKEKNVRKGLFLITLGSFAVTGTNLFSKLVASQNYSIIWALFAVNCFLFLFSYIDLRKNNEKISATKNEIIYGLFSGALLSIGFFFFFMSLQNGPVSIVFLINSLSFVIPITLSVLFLKEHFSFRKAGIILLTLISIILLQK